MHKPIEVIVITSKTMANFLKNGGFSFFLQYNANKNVKNQNE